MRHYRTYTFSNYIWISALLLAVVVLMPYTVSASTVYSNGYYRYTVEDQSVTIISYKGPEAEVTVPNMIAGNPVNVIAEGAFARNKSVTVIHLPDTIMSVEEGAFGEGQKVIYDFDRGSGQDDDTVEADKPEEKDPSDKESKPGKIESKPSVDKPLENKPSENNPKEDKPSENKTTAENKPYITTDNEDNLILVDEDGNETVLDDSRDYRTVTDGSGSSVVEDSSGNTVSISSGGTVEFTDKNNNRVTYDVRTGNRTAEADDGSYSMEEVQIDEDDAAGKANKKLDSEAGIATDTVNPNGKTVGDTDESTIGNNGEESPEVRESEKSGEEGTETEDGKTVTDNAGSETVKSTDEMVVTSVVIVAALAVLVYIVFIRGKKK